MNEYEFKPGTPCVPYKDMLRVHLESGTLFDVHLGNVAAVLPLTCCCGGFPSALIVTVYGDERKTDNPYAAVKAIVDAWNADQRRRGLNLEPRPEIPS